MTTASLTPPERETVVNGCDEDDHITVWSAQRRIITRLRKLACAELLEEGYYGSTVWARFRLPAESLSFRNPVSAEERERRRQRAIDGGFEVSNTAHASRYQKERG